MTNDLPRRMGEAADTLAEAVVRRHGAPNPEIVEWSPEALRKVAEQFAAEDERRFDVGTLRELFVNRMTDFNLGEPGFRRNCADTLAHMVMQRLERRDAAQEPPALSQEAAIATLVHIFRESDIRGDYEHYAEQLLTSGMLTVRKATP